MDPQLADKNTALSVLSPRAEGSLVESPTTDDQTLEVVIRLSLGEATERGEHIQGKAREDAPLTAEQLAIQLHVTELEAALRSALDSRFARSFERAIDEDAQMIQFFQEIEDREREDRAFALGMTRSASRASTYPAAAAAIATPRAVRVLGSGSLVERRTEGAST